MSAPGTAPQTLADRLSSDVVSLIGTLRSPWTWILTLVLVALVIGAWRLRIALSQDRRLTPRVRAIASASVNAATVAIVAVVVTWFLWRRAPLLLGISLAVLAAAAGFGIAVRGRAWVWGLVMIWRGRVRIGDRLRFGGIDGNVVDVGIFGITVISDDGARVFVPNAKLSADTFSVASPEEVHPAQTTVRIPDREVTDEELETLRRIGALCPYRQSGGVVTVEPSSDRHAVVVTFRSWSEEAAKLAREHIQHAFAAVTAAAEGP
ncbi:MAG TPA: mechanosensitive ion channel domain-containing protein [Kofleriaceae bacterium]|nr:mechanosensitive ion channel domain-containing protein [Kofleriaceae bacterium]